MNPLPSQCADARPQRIAILVSLGLGLGLLAGWRSALPAAGAALRPPGAATLARASARVGAEPNGRSVPLAPSDADEVGARWLSFPIVDRSWRSLCDADLVVQNTGARPSKAVWLTWPMGTTGCGPTEAGPTHAVCSGLIAPGGTWSAPPVLPGQTSSAMLFSFTMQSVGEAGIGGGLAPSEPVGDAMCRVLTERVVGDPAAFQRFLQAFAEGGDFDGIALGAARGASLGAELTRSCADRSPERPARAGYLGVPAGRLLPPESGVDPDDPVYRVPMPAEGATAWVQNAGWQCVTVEILVRPSAVSDACGDPPTPVTCSAPLVLSPGQTRLVAVFRCGGARGTSSLELRSSGPLAVVVDAMEPLDPSLGSFAYNQLDAGDALSAPLALPEEEGLWLNRVLIQNTEALPRDLQVRRRDRRGAVDWSTDVRVCPQQVLAVDLPTRMFEPGSVDVALLGARDGAQPSGISALVEHTTLDRPVDRALYPMARNRAQASPVVRNGVVAIPRLTRGPKTSTELTIHNAVDAPGETNVVLYLFDANGLVDFECRGLAEREALQLDARSWRTDLGSGSWSALVSATFWSHEVFDASGRRLGNPVDLMVTTADRELAHLGAGAGLGEAMASLHQPPSRADVVGWSLPALPICPAFPTLPPSPTATPDATGTPSPTREVTATATASGSPSPTPDPSRRPPDPLYLPLLLARIDSWPTGFILIADTSADPARLVPEGRAGHLDATRVIGAHALSTLRAGRDLGGLVRYGGGGQAELYALSEDPAELVARLADFEVDQVRATTRPDLALAVVQKALEEMPGRYRGRALLLFVDGESRPEHLARAELRAASLRAAGAQIYVIAQSAPGLRSPADGRYAALAGRGDHLLAIDLGAPADLQRARLAVDRWSARGWAGGELGTPAYDRPMSWPPAPADTSSR